MSRYASDSSSGSNFTPAPAGTHPARCVQLIDLGTQRGEYAGEPTVRSTIVAQFELPSESVDTDKGPQPPLVSVFWTNSLHEKARMRGDLEAWRGRAFTTEELMRFDLQTILGKPCLVTVQHKPGSNGNVRARVTQISALPKGMTCPAQHNPSSAFWIDEFDQAKFDALPEGFKKMIRESDEYKAMQNGTRKPIAAGVDEDDIPF